MSEPLGRSDSTRAEQIATQGQGKTVLGPSVGELPQEKLKILGSCLKIAVQGVKIFYPDLTSRNLPDLHQAIRVARTPPFWVKARFLKNKRGDKPPVKTGLLSITRNEGVVARQTAGQEGGLIRAEKTSRGKVFFVQNFPQARPLRSSVMLIHRGEEFRGFRSDRPAYAGRLWKAVDTPQRPWRGQADEVDNGRWGGRKRDVPFHCCQQGETGEAPRQQRRRRGRHMQQRRMRLVCPSNDLDIYDHMGPSVANASGRATGRDKNTGRNIAFPFSEPLCERNAWGRGSDLKGDAKLPGKRAGQFVFKPVFLTTVEKIGRRIMVHEHGEYAPFLDSGDGGRRRAKGENRSGSRQDWRRGGRPEHHTAEHAHQRQDQNAETQTMVLHIDGGHIFYVRYCTARSSGVFDSLRLFTYRARVSTREKILDVAGRLFATQGYADTSLAQVARSAEVSKALILWHFNSKNDLFRAALQNFLSPYAIDATGLRGLSEREQFEKLIDDYYTFITDHLPSVKFVLGQVVREEENAKEVIDHVSDLYHVYQQLLTSILNQGRKTRVFRSDIQSAEEAALIMATLTGLLVQRLVDANSGVDALRLLARFKETLRSRLYTLEAAPPLGRIAACHPADGARSAAEER